MRENRGEREYVMEKDRKRSRERGEGGKGSQKEGDWKKGEKEC